ncbi:MAG: DUF3325 domain-containing protein [Pseudomonadota bacterium]
MIFGFLLTLAGALTLCVSMKKHFRQVFPSKTYAETSSRILRISGFVILAVAAVVCSSVKGVGLGLTWFAALLTVAVFSIAMALPYLTRRL